MKIPAEFLAQSRRTIESYEDYAVRYDEIVGHVPHPNDRAALERAAAIAGAGGRILEIGSGPGRDADFLEGLGVEVRRTDATRRFLELQAARGKAGELLDVITDELGGPYDAVVALAVLIHVPRDQIDQVLEKIARSLRQGGAFVVSMRDGDGEAGGKYHTVDWRRDAFAARIEAAGMELLSHSFRIGRNEQGWNTFLAMRPS
ncbi:methyltransferase type 12 [Mesorhizobium sp. LNHC220B00]|nr:class I SAM-dependent methyltransferase [Mesorhizobium sp. LNHC220B00]ESY87782.1 methyltransferase type 12 [Mesorhizobium sp. LNHC220B00]